VYNTKTQNGANSAKLNLLNTQTPSQIFSNNFANDTNELARSMVPTGALKCRRRRNAPASRVCTFTVEYYAGTDGAAVCARILAQTFRRNRQRPCAVGYETPHRNTITSYKDAAGGYCAGIVMRCVRALQLNSCTQTFHRGWLYVRKLLSDVDYV